MPHTPSKSHNEQCNRQVKCAQVITRSIATGLPHLLALGTSALTVYTILRVMYNNYDRIAVAANDVRTRVGGVYASVRSGAYRVECAVGAAPIQMAECQMIQGVNLILIQIVTQLAEFIYSIAQMKNVFGCAALVWGFMHPIGRILSPRRLVYEPLRRLCQWQIVYYGMWHRQYRTLCDGALLIVTSFVQSAARDRTQGAWRALEVENRPTFPRSCPGKMERAVTRSRASN